ncbi:hypothetical protein ILUMI_16565 [Ignelater luminosus]|uniref:Uncharacterized protein n=1 Tax=Ignelater luminosus TaxID=2038154 RepID=A0A8K0CS27_IGNLU|nr:hypothetical protein ILUMI_16565 [Ignelater luminosus]
MAVTGGPVKLLPDFDLQSSNAANEWKFWKSTFEDYLVAAGQDEVQDKVKLSILRNLIGMSSAKIMTTLNIPSDQENNYTFIIKSIDEYVNPRINECFERYNFLKRVQSEGESFEHFLTKCKQLVKSCNYTAIDPQQINEDKALRDKILMGIRDPSTREALLRIDQLTLEKAITFCRTSELSKQQSQQFQSDLHEVNFIKNKLGKNMISNNRDQKFVSSNNKMNKNKFKCRRCGTLHGPRQCPAYGQICRKCGIKNHFAISCRVKNVKTIECNSNSSSISNSFVNTIRVNNVCRS